MASTTSYSALNVVAVLDGVDVLGLFDGDDAIQVEPGADVGTGLVGAGGDAIFSQTADKSASVKLRLMHTSPTHRQLTQKWEAQRAGRLVGFPFDVEDTGSNEGGSGDKFYIQKAPTDSKGTVATVREWVLWTGDYKNKIPTNILV